MTNVKIDFVIQSGENGLDVFIVLNMMTSLQDIQGNISIWGPIL